MKNARYLSYQAVQLKSPDHEENTYMYKMAIPDEQKTIACSRPQSRSTEGGEHQPPCSREECRRTSCTICPGCYSVAKPGPKYNPRWYTEDHLEWSSNSLDHGLKKHRVSISGVVEELGDRTKTQIRKKIKAISSRQHEGRC